MNAKELTIMIEGFLEDKQNNNYTGDISFKFDFNQGGIRSCKKTENAKLKDKRNVYATKPKKK